MTGQASACETSPPADPTLCALTIGIEPAGQICCTDVVRAGKFATPKALPDLPGGAFELVVIRWWRGQDLNLRPSAYEPTASRPLWSALGCVGAGKRPIRCGHRDVLSAPVGAGWCWWCSRCVRVAADHAVPDGVARTRLTRRTAASRSRNSCMVMAGGCVVERCRPARLDPRRVAPLLRALGRVVVVAIDSMSLASTRSESWWPAWLHPSCTSAFER